MRDLRGWPQSVWEDVRYTFIATHVNEGGVIRFEMAKPSTI
jgi:hypothetical protein